MLAVVPKRSRAATAARGNKSWRTEAESDFDPRGVKGEGHDPAFSAVRLRYFVKPLSADPRGVERLIEAFRARCPVHRTFSKAVRIEEELHLR